MPKSTRSDEAWTEHRLREILAVASAVAAVLEGPYDALVMSDAQDRFLEDVERLESYLAPCAMWGKDTKAEPKELDVAYKNALFAIWKGFERLDLTQYREPEKKNSIGLELTYFCADAMRQQFKECVTYLRDLLRQRSESSEVEGNRFTEHETLVTLDQMAAVVNRSKRTLEKAKTKMPVPRVEGGGGKPDEWSWSEVRPWLEKEYGRALPARFPGVRAQ